MLGYFFINSTVPLVQSEPNCFFNKNFSRSKNSTAPDILILSFDVLTTILDMFRAEVIHSVYRKGICFSPKIRELVAMGGGMVKIVFLMICLHKCQQTRRYTIQEPVYVLNIYL